MPTLNYNAGIDSSDVILTYGRESTWGVDPGSGYRTIRLLNESLSESKARGRPGEIRADGQVAHAITNQVSVSGDINFAMSYGTFDEFLEGLVNGTEGTALNIDGAAGDIAATNADSKFSSGVGKFATVEVGQWIRTFGFTLGENNGFHRVTDKAGDDSDITVATTLTDETPAGTDAKIRGTMLRNGTDFWSYFIQKQLASALFLTYSGAYISGGSISASVGDFLQGTFNFLAKGENDETSDQTSGATAAPSGRVIDNVSGFQNFQVNDAAAGAVPQSITINVAKNNARGQYGLGSADAQGMGRGTLEITGTLSVYFTDFTLYQDYKNEPDRVVSFRCLDNTGAGYIITLPAATLMNPTIVAGGPDSDVLANFDLEGNKDETTTNCTIQIDRFDATAT